MSIIVEEAKVTKNIIQAKRNYISRFLVFILAAAISISLIGCSGEEDEEIDKPANYGDYGSEMAKELAARWPNRTPGSNQEAQAADYIAEAFSDLDYEVEIQPFTYYSESEEQTIMSSQNIIVHVRGEGFTVADEEGKTSDIRKTAVIGAHYDVSVTEEQAQAARLEQEELEQETTETSETDAEGTEEAEETQETEEDTLYVDVELPMPTLDKFDGIHNNASGIGVLLTVARELKEYKPGYDIVLAAFGAGNDSFAGSRAFLADLEEDELDRIDVMYNIDGIYAGDKVYAHAGHNSVLPGERKSYNMRRKLYEATDVYYEHELYTNNRFALYTNQSGISIPWGDVERGDTAIYREWTLRESDHTPFDLIDIPIVYFESYDYDSDSIENMKESSNPAFAATDGVLSGTAFDSTEYLESLFELSMSDDSSLTSEKAQVDMLTRRINNVAFIIDGSIKKGLYNAIDEE